MSDSRTSKELFKQAWATIIALDHENKFSALTEQLAIAGLQCSASEPSASAPKELDAAYAEYRSELRYEPNTISAFRAGYEAGKAAETAKTSCKYSDTGIHECKHCDDVWQATAEPPKADVEALIDSLVWAVRRDNDAGDQYTRQEVKDVRAELLAAIRAAQPPSADEVKHYEQRLRDVMRYTSHNPSCEYINKRQTRCSCGYSALAAIVLAEVGAPDSVSTKGIAP
jgi:hypothetical protein